MSTCMSPDCHVMPLAVLTSIPDLMALTEEVGSRWRNLGQYLSLANSQLEEIQLHCDDDIKHCREEVLKVSLGMRCGSHQMVMVGGV